MTVATAPTLGPEVLAKRDGTCPQCPEPVVKGESYIRPVVGRWPKPKWMHSTCATAYVRHLEEYSALNSEDGEETGSPAGGGWGK